ncbi:MAG: shikimate dehydrogenase [Sellimonas sp.]|uniref:shikimate dehydrogenase n=1 Tax=Sellimonas sp. TaxID=2021466 RepID=UPI0039A3C8FF
MSIKINGHTKLLGFFADPASHSKSPAMYNTAFEKLGINCVYLAFCINQDTLKDAIGSMRTLGMRGANLSMPNKTSVFPYLDHISKEADLCGAVNTIVNNDGILTGYNTDGTGAMMALQANSCPVRGKNLVVLGAGGAGTALIAQAALDGAKEISVFVREKSIQKHTAFIEKIRTATGCAVHLLSLEDTALLRSVLSDANILINATNVGMAPHTDASPIPGISFLHPGLFVMDIIYSPARTRLLEMADAAGCPNTNGLAMLLYQGAAAFRLYTGEDLPLEDVKKAWEM